ncbi:TIGR02281 family clan AA aspartic protease [Nitrogeniibacter mangrovi]|uniref:TIGR02281 family clan AA aspartic protease n=1 Tax=Nitrogeniibacter mangrovi TaxID=2016596 RepID=A0A6C1B5C7_9RHOO|nr:TIGR02281 family clan AA aspartic protease [Nitrogeniibacter mangrovi]QID18229.1 TIGR02281 family clan AA aspartic protease [Nitrogeniibacter mangrovi]
MSRIHAAVGVVGALLATMAGATEVAVSGLFPGKALLVIDGGRPTLVAPGRTVAGVRVVAIHGEQVVVDVDGQRKALRLGERVVNRGGGAAPGSVVNLHADGRGHFVTIGTINGSTMRFIVDTGASFVSLGRADAERAGIDYRKHGRPSAAQTANGIVRTWIVKLNTVKVGDVTLHNVDAAVHDTDLPVALLGMSFLNRMEMQREGDTLTLRRRY